MFPVPGLPIATFYFFFLGALGVFWPFFSLYLRDVGLAPQEITRVLMLSPLMGLFAPPAFGLVADAQRARGLLLRACSLGACLAFAGFWLAGGARSTIYVTTAAFALCRAPILSLTDASALEHVREHGGSYGRLRLWGSLGFLLAVLAGGRVLEQHGISSMVTMTTLLLCAGVVTALFVPAPPPESRPQALSAWIELLSDGKLWLFLAAVALGQLAGAAYDGCFSLHLAALGHGPRFVAEAWAIGIGAEVVLMAVVGRVLRVVPAERLFAFSLAVSAVRWLALANVRSPTVILCLQPLHGISFGYFYVAGVTLMRDRGGAETPTAAQGLFAAALALGSALGMAVAGRVLESGGGALLYTSASAVAVIGCACAAAFAWSARGLAAGA